MQERLFSRRTFLAVAGLSTAALLSGCTYTTPPSTLLDPTSTPNPSPFLGGPYQTNRIILGEAAGTMGLPQPFQPSGLPISASEYADLPKNVLAAVYFPSNERDHRPPTPNPLHVPSGPFPVLLYAHAFRGFLFANNGSHSANRDFTSLDVMLNHVASYGCIAVAPDLSWLPDTVTTQQSFDERAVVLAQYYAYLASLNSTLFAKQLDVSRVVLVGHSTGAGGVTHAGRIISGFSHPRSLSYGLIAPKFGGDSASDARNLLVLGGTLDVDQDADPEGAYSFAGTPKTLVTIPGANHFGYTDICTPDNHCNSSGLLDENGTISLAGQQQTGAAYLAALVRYYALEDGTARPYLIGGRMVEGLETLGVTGLQIQAAGFPPVTPPRPTVVPIQP